MIYLIYQQQPLKNEYAGGYEMVGYVNSLQEFQTICTSKQLTLIPKSWSNCDYCYGTPLSGGGYKNIHYPIPVDEFRG